MIYLDHAATSPPRCEALEAMWPYLTQAFGNPASTHAVGRAANEGLEAARADVASVLGCRPGEIVFTSGGTESNNLALIGMALARPRGRHVVLSAVEHEAIRESAELLRVHHGFTVDTVSVDHHGIVDTAALRQLVSDETSLVSVMYANNEVGTVQPIPDIASICRDVGVPLHSDAVQAGGVLRLSVDELGVDALTLSAHKFGGPRGVGLLYVRGGTSLVSTAPGGGQERGQRSGTVNVAGAVGASVALGFADASRGATSAREANLRDRLIAGVRASVPEARLTGHPTARLANHASFVVPGINGETVLQELEERGIICSSGSACSAGSEEASAVLLTMGMDVDTARSAVRFTLGPETTSDDIEGVLRAFPEAVAAVRALV